MKKYVILGCTIGIGGWQTYINNKIAGVVKYNWTPFAIGLNAPKKTDFFLPKLECFKNHHFYELNFYPSQINKKRISNIVLKVSNIISYKPGDEVVFEATTEELLLWAELFSKHFQGKAICVNVKNEFPKHSKLFLDYLMVKKNRGELLFVNNDALASLFDNYHSFDVSDKYVVSPLTFNEMFHDNKDYKNELKLNKYDYVIGAIGWMDKDYYPSLCRQLCLFAKKYNNKKIVVVLIGASSKGNIEKLFSKEFNNYINLSLLLLGSISPIPSNLIRCFDVCIASFGSAVLSDKAGVKTIMMYDHNDIPLGIMGYTLTQWPYHINRTNHEKTISEMIEMVLVNRICEKLDYHKTDYGVSETGEIQKHIDYLGKTSREKEFYDVLDINEAKGKFKLGAFIGNVFGFTFLERMVAFKNLLHR